MKTLASSVCLLLVTACGVNINVLSDAGISSTGSGGSSDARTTPAGGSDSAAAGGTNTGGQPCNDLQQTARAAFDNFITTHQACSSDSDCALVNSDDCISGCPSVANTTSAADALAYSAQLCNTYRAQGCGVPFIVDNCPALHATCASGTCVSSVGAGGSSGVGGGAGMGGSSSTAAGGTNTNSQACKDLQQTAQTAFNDFVATHQNCTTQADCATAGSISPCVFPCLNLMNTAFAADAAAYSSQLCSAFLAQGCSPYQLMCPAGPVACNSGSCQYAWGAGGSSSGGTGGVNGTGGASGGAGTTS